MLVHYCGILGEFDYDDTCFKFHTKTELILKGILVLEDGYFIYTGKEKDGSKIIIPDGIIDCSFMFFDNTRLVSTPHFPDTVIRCNHTFRRCTSLKTINKLPKNCISSNNMFQGCISIEYCKECMLGLSNLIICNEMFRDCENLLDSPILPHSIKYARHMFHNTSIKSVGRLPLSLVDCANMFEKCENLTEVHNLPDAYNYSYMFMGCKNLEFVSNFLPVSRFSHINAVNMFNGCSKLKQPPIFNKNITKLALVFLDCSLLSEKYHNNFDENPIVDYF